MVLRQPEVRYNSDTVLGALLAADVTEPSAIASLLQYYRYLETPWRAE